jgi:hypothetical protein
MIERIAVMGRAVGDRAGGRRVRVLTVPILSAHDPEYHTPVFWDVRQHSRFRRTTLDAGLQSFGSWYTPCPCPCPLSDIDFQASRENRNRTHHNWGVLEFLKIPSKSRLVISSRAVAVILMNSRNGAKSVIIMSEISVFTSSENTDFT